MAVEFHGRKFPCGAGSIIPAGPGYNDTSFQVCASRGMSAGQLELDGDEYIQSQFGFSYDNIGRDYGILLLFLVGLCLLNMWVVENMDWTSGRDGAFETADKRKRLMPSRKRDEESTDEVAATKRPHTEANPQQTKGHVGKSGAAFSWTDINYSVRQNNEDKQLLRGVSGFCQPGTLTALVGTSGAGKSTRKFGARKPFVSTG